MANRRGKFEEFNDGLLSVYRVNEEDLLVQKEALLRYGDEVTSVRRYYGARSVGGEITKTIHIPLIKSIESHDVIVIDGVQFDVESTQPDKSSLPPVLRVNLQKLDIHKQKEFASDE